LVKQKKLEKIKKQEKNKNNSSKKQKKTKKEKRGRPYTTRAKMPLRPYKKLTCRSIFIIEKSTPKCKAYSANKIVVCNDTRALFSGKAFYFFSHLRHICV